MLHWSGIEKASFSKRLHCLALNRGEITIEPTTPGWIIFTCYRGNIASRRGDNKYCWINTVSRQFAKIANAVRKNALVSCQQFCGLWLWQRFNHDMVVCPLFCIVSQCFARWCFIQCFERLCDVCSMVQCSVQAADVQYCGCALLPMLYWALLANPVPVLILQNENNTSE